MRRRLPYAARVGGRIGAFLLMSAIAATVAIQFAGIVAKNVAVAHEISATQAQIDTLRSQARAQQQTIERLGTAQGAIPEIHEKLKLVAPHEEIIYVRGLPSPTPQPETNWDAQP